MCRVGEGGEELTSSLQQEAMGVMGNTVFIWELAAVWEGHVFLSAN